MQKQKDKGTSADKWIQFDLTFIIYILFIYF